MVEKPHPASVPVRGSGAAVAPEDLQRVVVRVHPVPEVGGSRAVTQFALPQKKAPPLSLRPQVATNTYLLFDAPGDEFQGVAHIREHGGPGDIVTGQGVLHQVQVTLEPPNGVDSSVSRDIFVIYVDALCLTQKSTRSEATS